MDDAHRHHRRSIRLQGYDDTQHGMYFVTLCVHQRAPLFGVIHAGAIQLNDFGRVVLQAWFRTAEVRPYVRLGAYVVMPNHFHGIIAIVGDDVCDGGDEATPRPYDDDMPRGAPPKSLGAIAGGVKYAVTRRINELRGTPGGKVWQRNYYEHIVRDDADLARIQTSIRANPARWEKDRFYRG